MGNHVMASSKGTLVAVLMDAEDIDRLGKRKLSIGSHGYAQMWDCQRVTLVHRWILGLSKGDGLIGDHINGCKLDCRRASLRAVDASGSSQNVSGRGRSRFRGVYLTRQGRWQAKVKFRQRLYHLGVFATEEEAAAAAAAKRQELMPYFVRR